MKQQHKQATLLTFGILIAVSGIAFAILASHTQLGAGLGVLIILVGAYLIRQSKQIKEERELAHGGSDSMDKIRHSNRNIAVIIWSIVAGVLLLIAVGFLVCLVNYNFVWALYGFVISALATGITVGCILAVFAFGKFGGRS